MNLWKNFVRIDIVYRHIIMKDNREKFAEAYNLYSESVFRHLFFRIFSRARAEELMQDTFLELWKYLEEGNEVRNFKALVYRIATHRLIDEKRKHKEASLEELLAQDPGAEPIGASKAEMEKKILYREVFEELKNLKEEERGIFIMRYVDDLDPKEIAEIKNTSANNISVQLNRIVNKLRNRM